MPPYDQNPKRGREIINGFPTVAAKIASDKDKTTTIYRRFDRLSARNLLYMQAELAELEAEQDAYDAADLNDGDLVTKQSQSDWNEFVKCAYDEDGNGVPNRPRERAKMDLAKRVKVKLKEYRTFPNVPSSHRLFLRVVKHLLSDIYLPRFIDEALALHKTLFNGTPPSNSTIKALRNWFFNNDVEKRGYSGVPQLRGLSQYTYDDPADLVALRVPAEQDRLSRFIQRYFGVLFLVRRARFIFIPLQNYPFPRLEAIRINSSRLNKI